MFSQNDKVILTQEIKNSLSFLSVRRDIARCADVQFYKNQRFYNYVKKKYIKNRT